MVQCILAQAENRQLVTPRANRAYEAGKKILRTTERITDPVKPAGVTHERAGMKGMQVQRGIIEQTRGFGIPGEQHLKAAVELKPVHTIGTNAAAHLVRRFDHSTGDPAPD
ncbi:MAG: hypothetical protein IT391_03475 [Nitrospira sp.]|nr:hypothetical protein [Nitrospira sp.]